ncbi:MAG: metallophosphatase family protein [Candidatus Eremiobacteraeota bacterium]|nr:metallophosphatase family protein [Candidatus Eremiobacteraeota bacterium]
MRALTIGLIADTHMPQRARQLPDLLVRAFRSSQLTAILHMGDFTTPLAVEQLEAIAPVEGVAGNNDPPELHRRFGRKKIVEIGGVRIGMVHGDGVSRTAAERSWQAFAGAAVDVVLFGHSHVPMCERREGVWLINPGSPTDKRRSPFFSYGLLALKKKIITPRLAFF